MTIRKLKPETYKGYTIEITKLDLAEYLIQISKDNTLLYNNSVAIFSSRKEDVLSVAKDIVDFQFAEDVTQYKATSNVFPAQTFRTKQEAKDYISSSMKETRIMGLSATIETIKDDGSGVYEQYFTSSDGKYTLRGPVKTKQYQKHKYVKHNTKETKLVETFTHEKPFKIVEYTYDNNQCVNHKELSSFTSREEALKYLQTRDPLEASKY